MSPIDRAIAYCTSFDPSFPSRIRGAAPDRIAELEARLGRPPSEAHRRFLERLGVDRAWVDFGAFDPSVDAVLAAHRRTGGAVPEGYELFAVATDEPHEDAYLVAASPGAEPIVEAFNTRIGCDYGNLAGDVGTSLAGSLAELICLQPLERCQMARAPLQAAYGCLDPGADLLARFDAIADRHDLLSMWFSSARGRAVVGSATAVVARLAPGQSFVVSVAGADRTVFAGVTTALERELHLARVQRAR